MTVLQYESFWVCFILFPPSRDIIADSVEYMVNAHKSGCCLYTVSNCDKVTPGMLMAAMRLNIPVIFVSGGPMEAGRVKGCDHKVDLIDAMIVSAEPNVSDEEVNAVESAACPTCVHARVYFCKLQ